MNLQIYYIISIYKPLLLLSLLDLNCFNLFYQLFDSFLALSKWVGKRIKAD